MKLMSKDLNLAEDHVKWEMGLVRLVINALLDITEKMAVDNFVHGIKHGRELEQENQGINKYTYKD